MTKRTIFLAISIAFLISNAAAQGYVWTYQGKLTDNGFPANGVYDIRITQLEAIDQKIGADTIFEDVQVVKGVFSVNVTTGALILIENRLRFIEIAVRPGASSDAFTVLSPRQPVNMAPYAGRAGTAAEANYAVRATQADTSTSSTTADFALSAGTITSVLTIDKGGTGSSTQNFVDLSTNQTISGQKTFSSQVTIDDLRGRFLSITDVRGDTIFGSRIGSISISLGAPNQPLCSSLTGGFVSLCSSSIKFKHSIQDYNSGLSVIKRLRPVAYKWKEGDSDDVGLIAEEVDKIDPRLSIRLKDGTIHGVKYDRIGVVAINAIKEQQVEILELRNSVDRLRSEIDRLEAENRGLTKTVDAIKGLLCLTNGNSPLCRGSENDPK